MGSNFRALIAIAAMSAAALSVLTTSSSALASEASTPPFDFESAAIEAPFELAVDFALPIHACAPQSPEGAGAVELPPFDFPSAACARAVRATVAPPFVL